MLPFEQSGSMVAGEEVITASEGRLNPQFLTQDGEKPLYLQTIRHKNHPEVYWSGLPLTLSMCGSSYAMETEFIDLCITHYDIL